MRKTLFLSLCALAACAPALSITPPQALSEAQLRTHLFAFADDSMLGRRAGTEGGLKAARYIAAHLARAGLEPAGDDGTFYQAVPLVRTLTDPTSALSVAGESLRYGTDFVVASPRGRAPVITDVPVAFLGTSLADTVGWPPRATLQGKVILLDRTAQRGGFLGAAPAGYLSGVAAILIATHLDSLPAVARNPRSGLAVASLPAAMPPEPPSIFISPRVAELVLGAPLATLSVGAKGGTVSGEVRRREEALPTYNVVAILRGSDPALAGEYVVIGAHPDHVGTRETPLDHDSLRAVLLEAERRGHELGRRLTGAERSQIDVATDTLIRTGPPRPDSIFNGADDDGSGSILVLALAESFAASGVRPRRSVLFVWHHAEELGLLGSRHFTNNPTVQPQSIIAAINLDMVGRGSAQDKPGGGPRYVSVVGSRRLSTELGDMVEAVNARLVEPMQFDYEYDAAGHPERIYCRSDHANYARQGIPVVFFTTGLHADYHQLTDEPQYIDYAKMRRVGALAGALVREVANAERRPAVDQPRPDPFGPCVQ